MGQVLAVVLTARSAGRARVRGMMRRRFGRNHRITSVVGEPAMPAKGKLCGRQARRQRADRDRV